VPSLFWTPLRLSGAPREAGKFTSRCLAITCYKYSTVIDCCRAVPKVLVAHKLGKSRSDPNIANTRPRGLLFPIAVRTVVVFPSDPGQRHRAEPEAFLTRIHHGVMYAYMGSFLVGYVDRNSVGGENHRRRWRLCSSLVTDPCTIQPDIIYASYTPSALCDGTVPLL
jgi:hypothetical protein